MNPYQVALKAIRRARDLSKKLLIRLEYLPEWIVVEGTNHEIWYRAEIPWSWREFRPRSFVAKPKDLLAQLKHTPFERIKGVCLGEFAPAPTGDVEELKTVSLTEIAKVSHAMHRGDSRPHICGVRIEPGHVVATDGHRIAVSQLSDEQASGPSVRLPSKLVDQAVKHMAGDVEIEYGPEIVSVRCTREKVIETLTAHRDGFSEYPPWRTLFSSRVRGRCLARREELADSARRVAATHDHGFVRLRIGDPLAVFDSGIARDPQSATPAKDTPRLLEGRASFKIEYQVPAQNVSGAGTEIQVNGDYLAEALEALDCEEVEVLVCQEGDLEKSKAELQEAIKDGSPFWIQNRQENVERLRTQRPTLLELRAGNWRALIMGIRQ